MQLKFWPQAILIVGITNTVYFVPDTITRHKRHVPGMNDEFTCHFSFVHTHYRSWQHQKMPCFLHPKSYYMIWTSRLKSNCKGKHWQEEMSEVCFRETWALPLFAYVAWYTPQSCHPIPTASLLFAQCTEVPRIKTAICFPLGICLTDWFRIYCVLFKLFSEDGTSNFFVNSTAQPGTRQT